MTFPPSEDYYANRNANTKELSYDRQDVKYEQWRLDNKLLTYYLDAEGNFVINVGQEIDIVDQPGKIPEDSLNAFTLHITNMRSNVNIRQLLIESGWNTVQEVSINISSNGSVTTTSTSNAALTISGVYPRGITIVNDGYIVGANAHVKSDGSYVSPGNAIYVTTTDPCTIINNGTISGGNSFNSDIDDGYGIDGVDHVTLTKNGTINSTN